MLTVIKGCMFAGKTEQLLKRYKEVKGVLYKHAVDNRAGVHFVQTHNGIREKATPIAHIRDIAGTPIDKEIFIDEIQFFPVQETINAIKGRLLAGQNVTVAGLDKDFKGAKFGATQDLFNMADTKIEVFAECDVCGKLATENHRVSEDTEQVVIGGDDKYIPLCQNCFVNM